MRLGTDRTAPNGAPRISVVVPTHQRRELVLSLVDAFEKQDTDQPFEVVVVVDGSTDGTASALRGRSHPFPLRVIEQPNRGAARARNHGAETASGDVILFLDDDMEPHPGLLRVHLAAHDAGAEAVVGAIPLHPDSPDNIMAQSVGEWADELTARCARPGYRLGLNDIFTGQLSMRRSLFRELEGFDERFTAGATFGNADIDLGYRLVARGVEVVFQPDAISYQRYVVSARQFLPRWSQVGEADVRIARLHPDMSGLRSWSLKGHPPSILARAVVRSPRIARLLVAPFRFLAVSLVDGGRKDGFTRRLYAKVRQVHYWLGVATAGGPLDGDRVRVLCWHSIADLSHDRVLRDYGVPQPTFERQISQLRAAGWAFITPDELVRFLGSSARIPRRSLLLTFDDGYADLVNEASPVLAGNHAPAVAFIVSRWVGRYNRWDAEKGRSPRPLAGKEDLLRIADRGFEIGSHSRAHPRLAGSDDRTLIDEIEGSRRDLVAMGFRPPRLFAYPYGNHDARVQEAVRAGGYEAAFTTEPTAARRHVSPFAVPRIEVGPDDVGRRLLRMVRRGERAQGRDGWTRRARRIVRRRLGRLLRPRRSAG
jgi:GT2 family glycosyltransferase/peptidoglycan/xylan/chitin deacetylase (PgdA/CDA1 family)